MLNSESRTVEEAYTVACGTSDLRVEADVRGDADVIIASGMSPSTLGSALRRLHGEWDRAEKPRKPTVRQVEALKDAIPVDKDGLPDAKQRGSMARDQAYSWYVQELNFLMLKLKTLGTVRREIIAVAAGWRMENAALKASEVLGWWLHQGCPLCNQTKFQLVPNTNRQSVRLCHACRGSGVTVAPHGQDGKKIAAYLDEACSQSLGLIKKRLNAFHR